ncbi:MAG: low-specificity L-threonine aldolase [Firmicutes bacterium HGW-Firmicutes-1]|jgi:threonine aldolase|nr:MAG: low-specificity L-threonine aldolase [Firmicutes bacterium HGW-Firmicutes-1]
MIDLRSDTVTMPTWEMRVSMYEAVVGDDIYEDDPTVKELEDKAAKLVGKEASLFVPSGTFGNQLALFTHCNRGDEVIVGDDSHIVCHETGASAIIAGVQLRTINTEMGYMNINEIDAKIRKEENIHYPKTALICLENAYSNGRVLPLSYMKEVHNMAEKHSVHVHLDGARIFNAATYLKVAPTEITQYCDSVMFCLSKGLCAPVGSILAGSKSFIERARKNRKIMGGGLRQVGVLAAPALVSLDRMIPRLYQDHALALKLGEALNKIDGVQVFLDDIHINMVFFTLPERIQPDQLVSFFLENHIKINGPENGIWRFVTHNDVKEADIENVIDLLASY